MNTCYFGKYRGTVTENKDSQSIGRIRVNVPAVMGDKDTWANPCFPYAGKGAGVLVIPPKGSNVWVEFEGGNIDYPIWVGGFFVSKSDAQNQPPPIGPSVDSGTEEVVMQIGKNNTFTIIDATGDKGGIVLTSNNASITINDQGITLKDSNGGKIEIKNGTVSINGNNLVVQK